MRVFVRTSLCNDFLHISGEHNHPSNPDQVEVKLIRDKMKERILAETTPITKIYDEEIAKVTLSKAATAMIPTIIEYRMFLIQTETVSFRIFVFPSRFKYE